MRILFLSRWYPYPPDNGSKLRIFNLLRALSRRHKISLLSFREADDVTDEPDVERMREVCTAVRAVPYRRFRPGSAKSMVGLLSPRPRSLVDTYSPKMLAAVMDEYQRNGCDVLIASQLDMVPYALALPKVPSILEEVELAVYRDAMHRSGNIRSRLRAGVTWLKLSAYLRRVLPRFVACTVVSDVERAHLQQVVPGYPNVTVVPNAVDTSQYDHDYGLPQPNTLVFTGALTYSANHDAMRYFLEEVFPIVARAIPEVSLRITGKYDGVDLTSLPSRSGVELTGYLPDIRPLVAQSWASVVPLRVGGGTRLKILESMALGTPVVSTSKGAEGLGVTSGQDILIADDAKEFSVLLESLLHSPALRCRLSEAARRLVRTRYDWEVVARGINDLIEQNARSECVR